MSVSMASGHKMEFISARVSGKDEGTGIEDGDWERADEGFVFKTIDASCSRRLVGIVAEVGGGRWRKTLDDVFIFLPNLAFTDQPLPRETQDRLALSPRSRRSVDSHTGEVFL